MSARVARRGAPSRPGSVAGLVVCAFAAVLCAPLAACDDNQFKRVDEPWTLVGGEPRVDPSRPTIDRAGAESGPGDFVSSAPVQVDIFSQSSVSKVDILWMIDNSGSMQRKQEKIRANFDGFIQKIEASAESVDYRIGVVTTDVFNPQESGRLQNKAGLSHPWIGLDTCPRGTCDQKAAFEKNSSVGINGSADEKGILAVTMALTPPLSEGHNAGFLRDDAALFVIFVSDEEDSSCSPVAKSLHGGGCEETLTYGSVDYFVRQLRGLKGHGRQDLVTVGAIVATSDAETVCDSPLIAGVCPTGARKGCSDARVASDISVYAPRYIALAERTGGSATSICEDDYVEAVSTLGFLATGAKSAFVLSRTPYPEQAIVRVREKGSALAVEQTAGIDYTYEPCVTDSSGVVSGAVLNAIQFKPDSIPPVGATVEVEYPVNVRGVFCQ